jgi:hypothetical protein
MENEPDVVAIHKRSVDAGEGFLAAELRVKLALADHYAEKARNERNAAESKLGRYQWIKVDANAEMPTPCTNVLVCLTDSRIVGEAWFIEDRREWLADDDYYPFDAVTHWMPYPEPPNA